MADMARFCLEPGRGPYQWWQAEAWAGKTALASWFVTHPPAGVDVVSFFVTGRMAGHADGEAFLDAMIGQLTALVPARSVFPLPAGRRAVTWLSLLASAAEQSEGRGRRLVVVIDGLDEDEAGATPVRGQPSIASLLPRLPPPGTRFIITSRPDPGLPDDLPGRHPLRACRPSQLQASPVAGDAELLARQELRSLFAGDQVGIDTVGFITGSGGGLTRDDLSELTEAAPYKLESILRGVSGRSLHARASVDVRAPRDRQGADVYLFGHETLRVAAEEQLGRELSRYRQRINEWVGAYAEAGWPDTTPRYAARAYSRLLVATGNRSRLLALARDRRRHAFLMRATGSDDAALTEIRTAQYLTSLTKASLTCRQWRSWVLTGISSQRRTSTSRRICRRLGLSSDGSITPRRWPAYSIIRTARCVCWPMWRPPPPGPGTLRSGLGAGRSRCRHSRNRRLRAGRGPLPRCRRTREPGTRSGRRSRRSHKRRRLRPGKPARGRSRGPCWRPSRTQQAGQQPHRTGRPRRASRGPQTGTQTGRDSRGGRPRPYGRPQQGATARRRGRDTGPRRRRHPRRDPRAHHRQPGCPGLGARRGGHRPRPGRPQRPGAPTGRRRRGARPGSLRPLPAALLTRRCGRRPSSCRRARPGPGPREHHRRC
jgi:hypothetical protein